MRKNETYIVWKGVDIRDMGGKVLTPPVPSKLIERGDSKTVSGRSGEVWVSDGTYEAETLKLTISFEKESYELNHANEYLSGIGRLRFGDAHVEYDARISKVSPTYAGGDMLRVDVEFVYNPLGYQFPEEREIAYSLSGEGPFEIRVFGSGADSYPLIQLTGSGSVHVTSVNGSTGDMQYFSLIDIPSGSVILDSDPDVMDIYDMSGQNVNEVMIGDFFVLKPGVNVITIEPFAGDSITEIKIKPRLRAL